MNTKDAFAAALGAKLVSVKDAPGKLNDHDPYELTFERSDGSMIKVLIDGDCYGSICADVVTS